MSIKCPTISWLNPPIAPLRLYRVQQILGHGMVRPGGMQRLIRGVSHVTALNSGILPRESMVLEYLPTNWDYFKLL